MSQEVRWDCNLAFLGYTVVLPHLQRDGQGVRLGSYGITDPKCSTPGVIT